MKDMKESSAPSSGSEEKKARIVDLTPDMELKDETKGKIIDLIDARFSPPEAAVNAPSEPQPIQTESFDTASEGSEDKLVIGSPDKVEADVDAAFDLMQEKGTDEKPPEPEETPEPDEDEIDLSDTFSDLPMDDIALVSPVEETTTAEDGLEGEDEPELELFQEPDDESPPAPPIADQDIEEPRDTKVGETSDELEKRLDDVDPGDTIELTDVVMPVDLDTPIAPADAPEEKEQELSGLGQDSDPFPVQEIDQEDAPGVAAPTRSIEIEEEEEAIELTDIVDTESDDQPVAEVEALQQDDDDDVIELTDRVTPEELGLEDDDEVIELVDIVDPSELAADSGATQEELLAAQDDDDDVIELTDIVPAEEMTAAEVTGFETEMPIPETVDNIPPVTPEPAEDKVIRLDSVLDHVRRNKSKIVENMSHGLEEAISGPPSASDTTDGGIDMQEVREALGEPSELTDKELEEAIERIIRTKYAETIEKHIASVVEKVVTREMDSIKRNLMEDQEPDE